VLGSMTWASGMGNLPIALESSRAFFLRMLEAGRLGTGAVQEVIQFYHQDHLGSTAVVTDGEGNRQMEVAYLPFGARRNLVGRDRFEEPYSFTQKESDTETGLHYFEARYYASTSGRFASVDSVAKEPAGEALASPQRLNAYAYCEGRPIRCVDMTGRSSTEAKEPCRNASSYADNVGTFNDLGGGLGQTPNFGALFTVGIAIGQSAVSLACEPPKVAAAQVAGIAVGTTVTAFGLSTCPAFIAKGAMVGASIGVMVGGPAAPLTVSGGILLGASSAAVLCVGGSMMAGTIAKNVTTQGVSNLMDSSAASSLPAQSAISTPPPRTEAGSFVSPFPASTGSNEAPNCPLPTPVMLNKP
jgi:RHS repeat-associated protein